ncbi:MAG: ATP-binding protein [Candidatus Omnitrophota bacterium]
MKKFRDWKIKYKLFSGFVLITASLVAVGLYTIFSASIIKSKAREIERLDFSAVYLTTEMKETFLTLENSQADIFLTSRKEALETSSIHQEKFYILVSEFRQLAKDDLVIINELDILKAKFDNYVSEWEKFIEFFIDNSPQAGREEYKKIHILGLGVVNEIDIFQEEYISRLSESLGSIDSGARYTQRINIILLIASTILAVILSVFLTRRIVGPLTRLMQATKKVSQGDFAYSSYLIKDTKDELGDLTQSFAEMGKQLIIQMNQLREAADEWENTFNSITDSISIQNKACKLTKVNRAFSDLFHLKPKDIIGRNCYELVHGISKPHDLCLHKRAIETKQPASREFFEPHLGIYIEVSVSPIFDKDNEVNGSIHFIKDITVRKKAEENLEYAYKKLKDAQEKLIEATKLETVGKLASGVAHEVKNPLAIILMGVEFLSKKISPDENELSIVVEEMRDAVQHADDIVKGLLDFSRVTKLGLSPIDFNSVLDKSITLVKHICDSNRVKIVKNYTEGLPQVEIDRGKIEQVFINILVNATHAMPNGGSITIKTYQKKLTEAGGAVGRRSEDKFQLGEEVVIVEIEDTGAGIPLELLNKIFDPFFTTKREKGGTGLGLCVAKNIIDMHKGHIKIENKEQGHGVKVTIIFKIKKEGQLGG